MEWSSYWAFIAFVAVIIVIPGPDTAVSIKNALVGGRRQGTSAIAGIGAANLVQSTAAVTGLSVLITTVEPVFLAIKWVGAAYLVYLAVQALRSAIKGQYASDDTVSATPSRAVVAGLRQGFLCNITNPKVIAFNLAVFPQFLGGDPSVLASALYAISLPLLGSLYLAVVVVGVDKARAVFSRRRVRRIMDTVTGAALLGFGARLATE